MNRLEEYANGMIAMGWKPWDKKWKEIRHNDISQRLFLDHSEREVGNWVCRNTYEFSLNDLLSLESGFRQFVVEKRLAKSKGFIEICNGDSSQWQDDYWSVNWKEHEYRLMRSVIEKDKVKFLKDNLLPLTPKGDD